MIYHILLAFVVTFIITVVLGKIAIPSMFFTRTTKYS